MSVLGTLASGLPSNSLQGPPAPTTTFTSANERMKIRFALDDALTQIYHFRWSPHEAFEDAFVLSGASIPGFNYSIGGNPAQRAAARVLVENTWRRAANLALGGIMIERGEDYRCVSEDGYPGGSTIYICPRALEPAGANEDKVWMRRYIVLHEILHSCGVDDIRSPQCNGPFQKCYGSKNADRLRADPTLSSKNIDNYLLQVDRARYGAEVEQY